MAAITFPTTTRQRRSSVKSINEITYFIVRNTVTEFIESEEVLAVDYTPGSGIG
tara:strand:+ start:662 stop:823 length:162 start_codon:yes stop_codon:yes gene_type:complete